MAWRRPGDKPVITQSFDTYVSPMSWSLAIDKSPGSTHLPPGQNGRHFADDIFKCILVNEKVIFIMIKISFKFGPKGPNWR